MPFRPVHDVNNSVNTNHNERIDKCGNHPDVDPLDVESGGQWVEHINEEGGKGHEYSSINANDSFKHVSSSKVVGQLVYHN